MDEMRLDILTSLESLLHPAPSGISFPPDTTQRTRHHVTTLTVSALTSRPWLGQMNPPLASNCWSLCLLQVVCDGRREITFRASPRSLLGTNAEPIEVAWRIRVPEEICGVYKIESTERGT